MLIIVTRNTLDIGYKFVTIERVFLKETMLIINIIAINRKALKAIIWIINLIPYFTYI